MADCKPPPCRQCGRQPTFGAVFCPYCGTPLAPAASAQGGEPLPDRATLAGPCAVLLRDAERPNIPRLGRTVARVTQRPLTDVTREMRMCRGFVARGLEAAAARRLADELDAAGVGVIALPESALPALPEVTRMKSAAFATAGLDCEAYRWDSTERLHVGWEEIALISCARVEVREVRRAGAEHRVEVDDETTSLAVVALRPPNLIPKLETAVRLEYVIDVFLRAPDLRLRLDENTMAYALVGVGSLTDEGREYYRAARGILRYGGATPTNAGVRMLAENAPAEFWADLTFESKHDFDAYNLWLLQLLRYGLPLPE